MNVLANSRVYVAGHTGLVGSAVVRSLRRQGIDNLVLREEEALDLTDAAAVDAFFRSQEPEYIILAAAKVGGIKANNDYPADFIRINLQIQTNVIDAAFRYRAKKLLFLGSSCIYPKLAPQPMNEDQLLMGKLEPTNDAYAIAKIAGIFMCKSYNRQHGTNFIAAMPTNLYGPGDNFNVETSHVLPALICRFHEAKITNKQSITLWGTGTPRREFLYVEDLADALLFLLQHFDADSRHPDKLLINVGVGSDLTIRKLAELIQEVVGFRGELIWDNKMPDGTPQKLLDVAKIRELGWKATTPLIDGVKATYQWYLEHTPQATR